MIEKIIMDYLDANLGVPAYMEQPESKPASYVLIEKTGGGKTNQISSATIAIQSYADTFMNAASLNEEVKNAMESITELDEIGGCHLNSDYNFTDTSRKKYRYQAVFDITHY